ncbi:hypothetical protein SCHPADRAFT_868779 [Schizopora paradoxa]|uniref:Glycosyltransferase family 31 protein n=1 Tax=Schizopora paradoxa TaxID=27342 RepID=A0A0H2RZH9_9AGAM|nr:hypothetical protein SCHPADRAFT_868779 [Schizopora paradoxa]
MSSQEYNRDSFTRYSASDEAIPFSASTSSGPSKHFRARDGSISRTYFLPQQPDHLEQDETPLPSRPESPVLPQFVPSATSSAYTSDSESTPGSVFLRNRRSGSVSDDSYSSWLEHRLSRRRRRRKSGPRGFRTCKRLCGSVFSFVVAHPIAILLSLLFGAIFVVLLTLLLIHILEPDKEPLPWRLYCSIPRTSVTPPPLNASAFSPTYPFNALTHADLSTISSIIPAPFPPPNLEDLPPAGLFLGVFSMDSAVERRMLVRTTWANHERSRNGAGLGDAGRGTSRSVVRFILGRPSSSWEERIKLEAEMYNDIIILPIKENMNYGKTHAFFTWAASEAWVPPLMGEDAQNPYVPSFSYSNITAGHTVPLAQHDPISSREEWQISSKQSPWVRPDFVLKVDDDSFVMMAELEARLRLELHAKDTRFPHDKQRLSVVLHNSPNDGLRDPIATRNQSKSNDESLLERRVAPARKPQSNPLVGNETLNDPLVYWGYLVKNRFMGGEIYALSWNIVQWAASDPQIKGMTKGKEDKQVSKWVRAHPRADQIRWASERCWIYDHPRAGTVYSHGFLFPSEATRARKSIVSYLSSFPSVNEEPDSSPSATQASVDLGSPVSWAYSSVSTFGARYSPPISDLTSREGVEALVEGSEMSYVKEGGSVTVSEAWARREGRQERYEGKRVGGTTAVHFIKKNPWFLETAIALLEGSEYTEREAKHGAHGLREVLDSAKRMFSPSSKSSG